MFFFDNLSRFLSSAQEVIEEIVQDPERDPQIVQEVDQLIKIKAEREIDHPLEQMKKEASLKSGHKKNRIILHDQPTKINHLIDTKRSHQQGIEKGWLQFCLCI